MKTMFIIHQPGNAPRVGYQLGDEATSLRKWQESYPGAAIYVLQAPDVPPPGTAVVVTADEFLAIGDAKIALSPTEKEDSDEMHRMSHERRKRTVQEGRRSCGREC